MGAFARFEQPNRFGRLRRCAQKSDIGGRPPTFGHGNQCPPPHSTGKGFAGWPRQIVDAVERAARKCDGRFLLHPGRILVGSELGRGAPRLPWRRAGLWLRAAPVTSRVAHVYRPRLCGRYRPPLYPHRQSGRRLKPYYWPVKPRAARSMNRIGVGRAHRDIGAYAQLAAYPYPLIKMYRKARHIVGARGCSPGACQWRSRGARGVGYLCLNCLRAAGTLRARRW